MDAPIRVVIVDDHPVFRDGMRSLLESIPEVTVASEAATGQEAVDLAAGLRPDIVLMDIGLPQMNGIEATRAVLAACPTTRVLVLTMYEEPDSVFSALRAGARGYLLKDARSEEIVRAIKSRGRRRSNLRARDRRTPGYVLSPWRHGASAGCIFGAHEPRDRGPGSHRPRDDQSGDGSSFRSVAQDSPEPCIERPGQASCRGQDTGSFACAGGRSGLTEAFIRLSRRRILALIATRRDATVITLIHRQETISLLGIPLARYIDIDDAESVLRAIRETPPGKTIEIILHTPGGLVLAASQIARALTDHDGRVVAVVPHYAMSGGTLIALAADEIQLDRHAALGPVDLQLGQHVARSLVQVASMPGQHEDQTLLMTM